MALENSSKNDKPAYSPPNVPKPPSTLITTITTIKGVIRDPNHFINANYPYPNKQFTGHGFESINTKTNQEDEDNE